MRQFVQISKFSNIRKLNSEIANLLELSRYNVRNIVARYKNQKNNIVIYTG